MQKRGKSRASKSRKPVPKVKIFLAHDYHADGASCEFYRVGLKVYMTKKSATFAYDNQNKAHRCEFAPPVMSSIIKIGPYAYGYLTALADKVGKVKRKDVRIVKERAKLILGVKDTEDIDYDNVGYYDNKPVLIDFDECTINYDTNIG